MSATGTPATPPTAEDSVREWADRHLRDIEKDLDADGLTIISPMESGLEHLIKDAIESRTERRQRLFVILDTLGGIVEVVERIVHVFREHYSEVNFVIPDRAMSAGTVLAMSGDRIYMDYHSCLGPIDPQVYVDGRLVPALLYLEQYENLIMKSEKGDLSSAELVLLDKLDLAALRQFELARELTNDLLKRWLTEYKFKDWTETESSHKTVTHEMKQERAIEIANRLSDHTRWLTHGRGIDMKTLRDELNLKIDDLAERAELRRAIWDYFWFLRDFMSNSGINSFVHTPNFF